MKKYRTIKSFKDEDSLFRAMLMKLQNKISFCHKQMVNMAKNAIFKLYYSIYLKNLT